MHTAIPAGADERPPSSAWPAPPPPVVASEQLPPQPDPQRVKVLHVITRFIAGSGGNTLLSAAGMDPDRYETWVAGAPGGPLWEQAERAGVHVVRLDHMSERIAPREDLRCLIELVRLMRRERFTVVHTHCSKAGFLGRLAARIVRVPVVVHTFHIFAVHSGLSPLRRILYKTLDRMMRSSAHEYLAVAPRVAREAVETHLVRPGSVRVVPSAVELDRSTPDAGADVRRELGIAPDAPIVGTVGRLVAQKAPLDFVRMAARVREERPDTVFVMVGDTSLESRPLEKETREEAARLGVPVVFTGFRTDVTRVMSAFDVFVITSRYEGLGRALTEAMGSGRPVVATAVNGVPDLVQPGSTGLLAEPGDTAALAQCVLWLLAHPQEARRMGEQGRDRVRAMFGQDAMCALLDTVYSRLLGLPAPSTDPARAGTEAGDVVVLREVLAPAGRDGRTVTTRAPVGRP